jgi:CcmD family protein
LQGADFLRSTGKIYTVAVVALVIWLLVLFYLIRLEKKLKKIEDQMTK